MCRFPLFCFLRLKSTFGDMTSKVLENIRAERVQQDLTQMDMAEKMGMSLSSYGKFERGETQTTQEKVEKASSILGKDISSLVLGFDVTSRGADNLEESKEHRYISLLDELRDENRKLRETIASKDELIESLKHTINVLEDIRHMYEAQSPEK